MENKKDENHHRSNELRKNKIKLSQELDIIISDLEKNLEKRDVYKTQVKINLMCFL